MPFEPKIPVDQASIRELCRAFWAHWEVTKDLPAPGTCKTYGEVLDQQMPLIHLGDAVMEIVQELDPEDPEIARWREPAETEVAADAS